MKAKTARKMWLLLSFISAALICWALPAAIGLEKETWLYSTFDYFYAFFMGVAATIMAIYETD